uniref:Glycosyltransferase RgtA/B/C/D-like domain-containing protein n=1 Tax=Magnetococcus massalia (strain MO-1) TaxID=451514 RepID=A0A1S7LDX9_MAGMO|nr:Membrane protein of unknown function [Candidatus Magnetococcus massalia]
MLGWLLILIVAIVTGILTLHDPVIGGDGLEYVIPLHNAWDGLGYTIYSSFPGHAPPGLGLAALPFAGLTGSIALSPFIVSWLSYVTLLLLIVAHGQQRFSATGSGLAVALLASLPVLYEMASASMTESLFTLILVATFMRCLTIWHQGSSLGGWLGLALLFGFGYLVRPEMLPIGAGALLLLLLRTGVVPSGHGLRRLWGWKGPSLALITLLLIPLAYGNWLQSHTGHFSLTGKTPQAIMKKVEQTVDKKSPLNSTDRVLSKEASTLSYFAKLESETLLNRLKLGLWQERHLLHKHLNWLPVGLLLLGFIASMMNFRTGTLVEKRDAPSPEALFFLTPAFLFPLTVYPFYYVQSRFLIPYMAIILLACSLYAGEQLSRLFPRKANMSVAVVIGLIIGLPLLGGPFAQFEHAKNINHQARDAGLWIKQNKLGIVPEDVLSTTRGEVMNFYAVGDQRPIPYNPIGMYSPLLANGRPLPLGNSRFQWPKTARGVYCMVRGWQRNHVIVLKSRPSPPLAPLWHNPAIGRADGFTLVHQAESFQVYKLTPGPFTCPVADRTP